MSKLKSICDEVIKEYEQYCEDEASLFPFAERANKLARAAVVMEETLSHIQSYVDAQECRGDEDCDHCLIVYQTIEPALTAIERMFEK